VGFRRGENDIFVFDSVVHADSVRDKSTRSWTRANRRGFVSDAKLTLYSIDFTRIPVELTTPSYPIVASVWEGCVRVFRRYFIETNLDVRGGEWRIRFSTIAFFLIYRVPG